MSWSQLPGVASALIAAAILFPNSIGCQAFTRSGAKPVVAHRRSELPIPQRLHGKHVPASFLVRIRGGSTSIDLSANGDPDSSAKLLFYTLEGGMCPYAARTWITLLELGLPFERIEVNAQSKPEWFLEINPRGKVPAIQNTEDGTVIYESAICDEYLSDLARQMDESPPDGQKTWKLMPVDASDRAIMRLLNDHVDTQLGPAQYTYLMNKDAEKDKELLESLEKALSVLQDAIVSRGGAYLMGPDFTLADAHVLPFFLRLVVSLRHFKGYEIPRERFSPLLEWFDVCSKRKSVKETAKSEEKIIEVYKRFVEMDYSFGGLNKNK